MRRQKLGIKKVGIIQYMTGDGGCRSLGDVWERIGWVVGCKCFKQVGGGRGGERGEKVKETCRKTGWESLNFFHCV